MCALELEQAPVAVYTLILVPLEVGAPGEMCVAVCVLEPVRWCRCRALLPDVFEAMLGWQRDLSVGATAKLPTNIFCYHEVYAGTIFLDPYA